MKFRSRKKNDITSEKGIIFQTPSRNLVALKDHAKTNRHLSVIQWNKEYAANQIAKDDYQENIISNAHGDGSEGSVPFPYLVTARMVRLAYTEVSIDRFSLI